eukprot:2933180-Pyramimonas_sp.AAC.1
MRIQPDPSYIKNHRGKQSLNFPELCTLWWISAWPVCRVLEAYHSRRGRSYGHPTRHYYDT